MLGVRDKYSDVRSAAALHAAIMFAAPFPASTGELAQKQKTRLRKRASIGVLTQKQDYVCFALFSSGEKARFIV